MSFTITRPSGEVLRLDRTDAESYSPSSTITEHPIEDGSTVSDHIQSRPLPITVEGIITESPYDRGDVGVLIGRTGVDRINAALEFLRAASTEILTVESTRLGSFSSYGLASYQHRIGVLRELRLSLNLRQVRLAEVETVSIPPLAPAPTQSTGAPDGQDAGQQASADTEGEDDATDKSAAVSLLEAVGFF